MPRVDGGEPGSGGVSALGMPDSHFDAAGAVFPLWGALQARPAVRMP